MDSVGSLFDHVLAIPSSRPASSRYLSHLHELLASVERELPISVGMPTYVCPETRY
jgi:hypothetical protein